MLAGAAGNAEMPSCRLPEPPCSQLRFRDRQLFLQYRGLPPSPIAAPPSGRVNVRASMNLPLQPLPNSAPTVARSICGDRLLQGRTQDGVPGSGTQQTTASRHYMRFAPLCLAKLPSVKPTFAPMAMEKLIDLRSSGYRFGRPPTYVRSGELAGVDAWPPATIQAGNPRKTICKTKVFSTPRRVINVPVGMRCHSSYSVSNDNQLSH